ncbi:hypothetical protein VNO77_00935 [Canavalia gladiata]|uniref:Uncharacterized protein n=1 Tax=Canavalia gladiata TaxID=3824 RepID=A0AAN9MR05_CANGL
MEMFATHKQLLQGQLCTSAKTRAGSIIGSMLNVFGLFPRGSLRCGAYSVVCYPFSLRSKSVMKIHETDFLEFVVLFELLKI